MKKQVYWGWNEDSIELFNEDGHIVFSWPAAYYVDWGAVVGFYRNQNTVPGDYKWSHAKEYTKKYGITPANVAKKFNGISYSQVVSKHPNWVKVVQTRKGRIKPNLFHSIESVDLVDQAVKDGLKNITPLIVLFNESPKELKKRFGDSNWKALCKNSFSRNRLIYHALNQHWLAPIEAEIVMYYNNYPSTLFRNKWYTRDYESVMLALKTVNCSMAKMDEIKNRRELNKICDIWRDTKSMCERQGVTFNPRWSWRRIQEEHHRMVAEQQREAQRMQAERDAEYAKLLNVDFRTLHKGLEIIEFDSGVIATPLINMEQVQIQGQKEHHCVGIYASSCAHGNYLVWSLKKGEVKSTLGINVIEPRPVAQRGVVDVYVASQHYHACNKSVEDQDFIDAASKIVKMLNEKNKVEKALDKELEAA